MKGAPRIRLFPNYKVTGYLQGCLTCKRRSERAPFDLLLIIFSPFFNFVKNPHGCNNYAVMCGVHWRKAPSPVVNKKQ